MPAPQTREQILFGRVCRLLVEDSAEKEIAKTKTTVTVETTTNTLEILGGIGGMRIQANIKKTLKKEPNTSEIRITNLSPTTRASLQKKGVRAMLEAGYQDTGLSRLFSGNVRAVDHMREGANWITVLRLGDGERAWQYGRVNESFAAGTRIVDVIRAIAQQMGFDSTNIERQFNAAKDASKHKVPDKLDHGWAASGAASRAMDRIIKSAHLTWSVQDNQIQILAEGQALDVVYEFSPSTGLVGSPEMGSPTKKGRPALVKFDALLTPVKPGAKAKLKSDRYNGTVKLLGVEFDLDTHGGPWYTRMSGEIAK